MATAQELKDRIDLHDLAAKLGIKRPGNRGNYRSPHHDDKSASLEIGTKHSGGKGWVDWSSGEKGTCIDLVMYIEGCDSGAAMRRLHELYGWPLDKPKDAPQRERTKVEWIADKCFEAPDKAIEYLKGRGLDEAVIRRAIARKSIGFNDWESDKIPAGEPMHGGPAVAFMVRSLNPGHLAAVDMRYLDPKLNGGVKTQCQGDKDGIGWISDVRRIETAKTIVIVESPINALSVECADLPYTEAFATRGLSNVNGIDWRFLQGKRVVICMDNDQPFPDGHRMAGHRPGPEAAWKLQEILTSLDVASHVVDQESWGELNDINDILKEKGGDEVKRCLRRLEPWLIPGVWGRTEGKEALQLGRPRIYLPGHDYAVYWRYRLKEDFTTHVDEVKKKTEEEGGKEENRGEFFIFSDLCGFRLASLSRVTIAGTVATMTGDPDTQPRVMFAISVQTPRHGPKLLRRVVDDEKLHNIDQWKRFGPVFNQSKFLRMVNILERTAHIGARNAANFVGLCYRDGKLIVNEGPDCYFTNPEQQCPYHNLIFPAGTRQEGRTVLEAYQKTFKRNAAAIALVWGLGGHLKAFLGSWPHITIQASKGSGKSTLTKRFERTLGMTMFSGQSLNTEFRLLTSISHTSHPVGWEELSARRQEIIDKAVSLLQECYQYTLNRRGADLTEFLLSAPVMLAGEDVPVKSLTGKLVRTELTGKKGPLMVDDLPRFPVRQWLIFLSEQSRPSVMKILSSMKAKCEAACMAKGEDDGAVRMLNNYASVMTAWRLLCEFLDIDPDNGGFEQDLIAEMNGHIRETSADRQPWVWIVETLLSEIAAKKFVHPYCWDTIDGHQCLMVRTSHVMDHLAHTNSLRDKWNGLPIKSDRIFKKELVAAKVLIRDEDGTPREFEKTLGGSINSNGQRVGHLIGLDLDALSTYGLYGTPSA
jgi:hypothetical protein